MIYQSNNNYAGIMNVYGFSPKTAALLQPLFEHTLKDPDSSTILPAYRELLMAYASSSSNNVFSYNLHRAMALLDLEEGVVVALLNEEELTNPSPELLKLEGMVQLMDRICNVSPMAINNDDIRSLKEKYGISEREAHDVVLIYSLEGFITSYLEYSYQDNPGLGLKEYSKLAVIIKEEGYTNGTLKSLNTV